MPVKRALSEDIERLVSSQSSKASSSTSLDKKPKTTPKKGPTIAPSAKFADGKTARAKYAEMIIGCGLKHLAKGEVEMQVSVVSMTKR